MTHYFRNEAGNRVIAVDGDRVTEFALLFTMGSDSTLDIETVTQVAEVEEVENVRKPVDTKSVKTKKKSKKDMTPEEKKVAKKEYMREYMKKYKDKNGTGNSVVAHEPNLKLIQEYGKSAIDAIINCKKEGMTVDEIDQDQPKGVAHLTYGQIEMLYDSVVL